jgi:hypothetical protein
MVPTLVVYFGFVAMYPPGISLICPRDPLSPHKPSNSRNPALLLYGHWKVMFLSFAMKLSQATYCISQHHISHASLP